MKLKNKKTGEIKPAEAREDGIYLYDETTEQWYKYELDLLAKWWEYYEEPKGFWHITVLNGVLYSENMEDPFTGVEEKKYKEIGNYFETKEEAEKAVEKLKAWKRLKDKGFKFVGWDKALRRQEPCDFVIFCDFDGLVESERDLDLLFGGNDEV